MARTSMWLAGLALVTALLGSVASTRAQNFGKVDGARFLTLDWERSEYRGSPQSMATSTTAGSRRPTTFR